MSEIKRAPLIPLASHKEPDKSSKDLRKTIRISIVLPESTEDTCPEYNYKDELATAKKQDKYKESGGAVNGLSRLEEFDDDDDVKRIARQMEEKYGTGTSMTKKKRKIRKDDYADIGMGYDESDSFIDNTDGYDEMIPQNVTTLHGGFYINSGALEFKTDDEANSDFSSSSSDEDDHSKGPPIRKKRVIESSDETDRENKTESADNSNHSKKRKLQQNGGNGVQQSLKKKLLGQQNNKIYIKKRRLLDPLKKTVKELLREKREDLDMSIPDDLKNNSVVEEEQKDSKKTISTVTDVIESVVKGSIEEAKPVEEPKPAKIITVNSSSDGDSSRDNATATHVNDVKLPENLPADILSLITSITDRNKDGKNVFSAEVNSLVLRLERKCKCLGKPSKVKVYEHLAACFKVKTEVLIKQAKSMVLEDEQKRLKSLLTGLRSEINKIMPSLLDGYEKESQRILQKRYQESAETEENKNLRMPKRRFQWNDITKKMLKDILMLKKRCLLLEGKSKDDLDTVMTTFLRSEIQIMWPEGWMSMNALTKIYTTYGDTKRLLSNANGTTQAPSSSAQAKPSSSSSVTVKNLPQSFNNSNLSITPIVTGTVKSESSAIKIHSVTNEMTVSKTSDTHTSLNLSKKPLPEPAQTCDIKPVLSPSLESKVKLKSQSDLLKPPVSNHVTSNAILDPPLKTDRFSPNKDNSVIILDSPLKTDRFSPNKAKSDDNYCQVIDLSDKNDLKKAMISDHVSKHHELSITPAYPKTEPPHPKPKTSSAAGDDIQKVMENLKNLQKMSSPKKSVEAAPSSSAVSVIAVNKTFAPKPVHAESTMQRYDYKPSEYGHAHNQTSFQDEFQKQLFSALNQYSTGPSKNYNRYPHITSGAGMAAGDKYYQNSNNNYAQSSNGHKSSTSTAQSATAPKSQQK